MNTQTIVNEPSATAAPTTPTLIVQVLQENIDRALKIVAPAVPKRSTLPILASVHMGTDRGRLRITATDLDLLISVEVGAKVDSEGAITMPFRMLADTVKSFPSATVAIDEQSPTMTRLRCARADITLECLPAADYPMFRPSLAPKDPLECFAVNPGELAAAIRFVEKSAASDDSRPVSTGVNLTGKAGQRTIELAAADGFRLAVRTLAVELPLRESFSVILPVRAARVIEKTIRVAKWRDPIHVSVDASFMHPLIFEIGDVTISSTRIVGTFPNYVQLIPKDMPNVATFDRDAFATALQTVAISARDSFGIVRIEATCDVLRLSAKSAAVADTAILIDAVTRLSGMTHRIAFNSKYLQDAIAAMGESLTLEFDSASRQGLFTSNDSAGGQIVVMPMFAQW